MGTARSLRRVAPFREIAPVDHFVRLFGIEVRRLAVAVNDLLTKRAHPSRTETNQLGDD
jgi:hypothetical protein